MILWRVIKGEENLGTTLVICACVLIAYHLYDYIAPSFTDFFRVWFKSLYLGLVAYCAVSVHESCKQTGWAWRMVARTIVIGFILWGSLWAYNHFGAGWAIAYPIIVIIMAFLIED